MGVKSLLILLAAATSCCVAASGAEAHQVQTLEGERDRAKDARGTHAERAGGDPGDHPYWRRNLFTRVFTDQEFLVCRWWPAEFKHAAFTLPLVAGTVVAANSDDPKDSTPDFALERHVEVAGSGRAHEIAAAFTDIGNGAVVAAFLGTSYLISRRTRHDQMAQVSSLAAESLLDAGIWIEVLKHVTARVRPNEEGEGRFFQYGRPSNASFPSGHAMGAFAVATVFAEKYRDHRWMPWVAYGTAALIGSSRVALGRHFPSDVLVGGVLGNSIGRGVIAREREEDPARKQLRVERLIPVVDPAGEAYGVAYSCAW